VYATLARLRLLLGISLFWLALSLLFDGLNTLVLPNQLLGRVNAGRQATVLGLLSFCGLLAGMLVQPVAGTLSDRLRPRWGRRGMVGLGLALVLAALALFGLARSLAGIALGYLAVQVAAGVAQAGQQGFIPDLVPARSRGAAAGWKGFMDIGGAMLGFILLGQLLGGGQDRLALAAIGLVLVAAFLLTVLLVPEDRPGPQPVQGENINSFSRSAGHAKRSTDQKRGNQNLLAAAFHLDLSRHRAFAWLVASRFLFLLGTYAVGRFLLLFVAGRLGLSADQAAEQAGNLLAGLALVTVLAAPLAGWAADRWGRLPLMLAGAVLSAAGTLLLIFAGSGGQILLFGALMSLGSAAFAGANWAMTADLAPPDEAGRFFGLANFGTAGAAAAAGLFGPLVDAADRLAPGSGYPALFVAAALASLASALALRGVSAGRAESPPGYQEIHSPQR
jgi:MFS family permease